VPRRVGDEHSVARAWFVGEVELPSVLHARATAAMERDELVLELLQPCHRANASPWLEDRLEGVVREMGGDHRTFLCRVGRCLVTHGVAALLDVVSRIAAVIALAARSR
jgi:hypothetical protein